MVDLTSLGLREFDAIYRVHWELTYLVVSTGRRLFFGLFPERVNCQPDFPSEFSLPMSADARASESPRAHVRYFNMRVKGRFTEKGYFGHRGISRYKFHIQEILKVAEVIHRR